MKIGVIALGSWGTAVSNLMAFNGHEVTSYARSQEFIDELTREGVNKKYLPNVKINSNIIMTSNVKDAVVGADMIISAVPTQSFRQSYESYRQLLDNDVIFVNLAKGIEISSGLTLSKVAKLKNYVALSGPTHAEEVGDFHPSAIVAASESEEAARAVQKAFSNEFFRVYRSDDLLGVEIAGALKNVIALGAGIISGIGYGDNAKAALITRGLYEIRKFGVALGADKSTFSGLAGVGDMIVTCASRHSRNFRCGELIGKGFTPKEAAERVGMVVEGVHTVRAVKLMFDQSVGFVSEHEHADMMAAENFSVLNESASNSKIEGYGKAVGFDLSKLSDVEMPITEMLYKVIYEEYSPREAIKILMNRKYKHENE